MSKYLFFVFFILLAFVSKGQVYQSMPQWGYGPVKRFDIDSSLTIPTTCGVPTLKTTLTKKAAIAFDSCNNKFYKYNPKTQIWSEISGTTIDTTSLSNRIDLRVQYSDTSLMLQNYLKEIDTASLSSRIDLKLFISDTTNKWVTSVTKVDDSTIRVVKGTTTTDIVLSPATSVTAATRLQTQVYNNSGSTITKGSVIYINGRHSSNLPTIALAQANTEQNSYSTFALVLNDIPTSSSGTVVQAGNIGNLNLPTSSYTDGDLVYLSPSVAGGITTTKPLAPNHIVKIGTITRAHPTFGSIELKIENGWQLDELSDVKIALVPSDSTLLQFSRVDSLWHDVSPTTAIGSRYIKPSDTATMLTNYVTNVNYGLIKSSKTISADTSKLSTLYQTNLKINISDSASMLSKYLRKIDTASLSSRINLKVNISDTASMLTPYLRSTTASGTYATISSLSSYLQKSDSTIFYPIYRSDTSRTNIYNQILGKQSTLTFSTGLTNTSGTITNNLSVGVSGGQSVVGGTASGNNLTLSTTSNATKGKIILGTASAYDQANDRLGISTTSPAVKLDVSGNTTTLNTAQFGTMGVQSFATNNAWFGDNVYYNGSGFIRRAAGYTGAFYFQGNEGQFRWGSNAGSGTTVTNGSSGAGVVSLKTNLDKTFAVGDMPTASSSYTGATFIVFGATGNAAINTTTDNGFKLDVNGTARANQFQLSALNTAPASATATGTTGEIRIVNGFIYVCVATNTWQRATLSTW